MQYNPKEDVRLEKKTKAIIDKGKAIEERN